jgi:PmbA protein
MERVISELTDHKAEGDLIFSTSKSLKMSSQQGSISEYKVTSSQILGVRAIRDGKVGISYSEALDDESIRLMIRQSLDNAECGVVNDHEKILPLQGELSDIANYSESPVDINEKTKKALTLEGRVKELDTRVTAVPYNSYSENEFSSMYLSSRGRFTSFGDRVYSITSSALMEENGKKANYYDYDSAHRFQDLQWDKVIDTSLFHARNLLQEKMLSTGKYQVVFSEDCLKSLMDCFGNFYSAKSAMDKLNPWADKTGDVVTSSDLTISDHPFYPDAFRRSLFDSEGIEQKPLNLIEKGVLKNFYHNSVTASHFGTLTTGHASRGPASSLSVSGTHMIIQGDKVKPTPVRYLKIIQMDGLYSGANRVNGNFSVAIKGYLYENGENVMTFGNCTLSGNLMELLKNVSVTGHALNASTDRSFFSVPLVFHDLSVAGI